MKRVPLALALLGFLVFAAADRLFLGAEHGEFWWSRLHGFFALFAFAGSLAIIAATKVIFGRWLHRDENYYDR